MSTASTGNSPHEFVNATFPEGCPLELKDIVENATRNVFQRHGAPAFQALREAAIAHEVGHAIVGTHEGLTVKSVRVFFRKMPLLGNVWGGWYAEKDSKGWTTGPDTSAESDLSRARIIIAGLAGEAITKLDKPGSSLDELALSQLVGSNAAFKLHDPTLSNAEYSAYAKELWNEQVWRKTLTILSINAIRATRRASSPDREGQRQQVARHTHPSQKDRT
jgi:hypothetical protein